MAVTETFNDISYIGNGSNVDFDLATKVFATSEVSVFLKTIATGVVIPLDEGAGAGEYSIAAISGDLDNGVRVTTVDTYTSASQITLERIVEETQDLNLEEGGDLPANELEDALDRSIMIAQQITSLQERSAVHPVTDTAGLNYDIPSDTERASKAFGWDEDGNVVALSLVSSGTVTVDTSKGLDITGNQIFGKADDTSIEFDGTGAFSVRDGGIEAAHLASSSVETAKVADSAVTKAKIEDVATATVLGRATAGSGVVEELAIDSDLSSVSASNDTIPSAKATKAAIVASSTDGFVPTTDVGGESVTLPNGRIMKAGRIATAGADTPVTYVDPFPNGVVSVVVTAEDTGDSALSSPINIGGTRSTTAFNIRTSSGADFFNWQAIGY